MVAEKKVKRKKVVGEDEGGAVAALKPKKKKMDTTAANGTPAVKKKKKKGADETMLKKKKRKKLMSNSTMLMTPSQDKKKEEKEEEEEEETSDKELFGSQSPSPIKMQSPPPLTKYAGTPVKNSQSSDEDEDSDGIDDLPTDSESEETPLVVVEEKPLTKEVSKSPAKKKIAKKTKIVPATKSDPAQPKTPTKSAPLVPPKPALKSPAKSAAPLEPKSPGDACDDEDDDDDLDDLVEEAPGVPPLSMPLISRQEQKNRDLLLLTQIREKFGAHRPSEINWNTLMVYNMSPEEMQERYEVLLKFIKLEKDNTQLVTEAIISLVNAEVRALPVSCQSLVNKPVTVKDQAAKHKRVNAFTVFASGFDQPTSVDTVRGLWDVLDVKEKQKLKREAKALNNANGLFKATRKLSRYNVFCAQNMKMGMKMAEIGKLWKEMSEGEKDAYKAKTECEDLVVDEI